MASRHQDGLASERVSNGDACAGLLTPQQQEEWNTFHAATWLSKAVRAAVRFAPWTLKGLAKISETRIGGRALYNSVLKGLVSKSLMPYCFCNVAVTPACSTH